MLAVNAYDVFLRAAIPYVRKCLGVAVMALSLVGCVSNRISVPVSSTPGNKLPSFSNTNHSPAGAGVDFCLHNERVRLNPGSNPNLAWDDESAFTIMGHGLNNAPFGPAMIDERGPVEKMLTSKELVKVLREDPVLNEKLMKSRYVVLYSCRTGSLTSEGFSSFGARLANLLESPVIAPSGRLLMGAGKGVVEGGGKYEVFYPRSYYARANGAKSIWPVANHADPNVVLKGGDGNAFARYAATSSH